MRESERVRKNPPNRTHVTHTNEAPYNFGLWRLIQKRIEIFF